MSALALRPLGGSTLAITRVGIGTAPIGSSPGWSIDWGPQDETDALRAIHTAMDLGINWIDTAPFYGWGRAEQLVGRALRGRRDGMLIFTKCGTLPTRSGAWYENLTPASIRREVEASLRNLQTDYIDLYQLHDPDPTTPIEESWQAMQALIDEGKVRYGGLSNHPVELVERALAVAPVIANQHQYNLLNRAIEQSVLPFSAQHHIGVLAWAPLASGFLVDSFDVHRLSATDFRRRLAYAQPPAYQQLSQLRAMLQRIAQRHGRTLRDLAIAWVLRQPSVTGAIIGIRNAYEARAMVEGIDWDLTNDDLARIEQALAHWRDQS
ncbi:MAG TPA: aldo/keto reductase [Herpetosiphonaceae bacterium]